MQKSRPQPLRFCFVGASAERIMQSGLEQSGDEFFQMFHVSKDNSETIFLYRSMAFEETAMIIDFDDFFVR